MEKLVTIHNDLEVPYFGNVKAGEPPRYWVTDRGKMLPMVSGGIDNPVRHPLLAPTITGTDITVDMMLQQPTRVTTFLMDITLQRFILDRLFTSAGGVSGGAVVFDILQGNDLYLNREIGGPIRPGTEFPVVSSPRRAPSVAEVEKYGGKYWFSDEARDRNDLTAFRNENVRLGNTIVKKLNTRAIEILEAAIAANGGQSTFVGHDWSAAVPPGIGNLSTLPAVAPGADFANAQLLADVQELGISYNVFLCNPVNLNELRLFYQGSLNQMLADNGFDEVYATNRITVGSGYFVASGQIGEMRIEQPLGTESWREQPTQRTWVQSSVRPLMFVNNPFAVMKVTGL
jgi:hypothetical protein